jgi:hypothetical protein
MSAVSESDAAAIRAVFSEEGELSAVIELRRRFRGITDNAKARECVRMIAGWRPSTEPVPYTVTTLCPDRKGVEVRPRFLC